jgi:hypothetical protein
MLRRNWLSHVAACGAVVACLFASYGSVGQEPRQPGGASQPAQAQPQEPSPNQSRPAPVAEPRQPVPIAEPEKPKTPVYKSACGETEHHPEADLCEQRRMAKAAIQTMIWTKWQAIGGWLRTCRCTGDFDLYRLGYARRDSGRRSCREHPRRYAGHFAARIAGLRVRGVRFHQQRDQCPAQSRRASSPDFGCSRDPPE